MISARKSKNNTERFAFLFFKAEIIFQASTNLEVCMTKKEETEKKDLNWLTTSSEVKVVAKNGKVMFFINKKDCECCFSYSIKYFQKILEKNS